MKTIGEHAEQLRQHLGLYPEQGTVGVSDDTIYVYYYHKKPEEVTTWKGYKVVYQRLGKPIPLEAN